MILPGGLNWFNLSAFLLAGFFNLLGAWKSLDQELQIHPFIQPRRNFWVWVWSLTQMLCAGIICLLLLDLPNKPVPNDFTDITQTLFKAALVGSGFNAILNADEATDFLGSNLSPIYKNLIDPITLKIHATQARHTDRFWSELCRHLTNSSTAQINDGMNLIREKLTNSKNLTKERRDTLWIAVNQIQDPEISSQKRPEKIVKLLKDFVRRHDLPEILNVMGCEEEFLRTYVPKRSQNQFLSNHSPFA
jgi:hypothetical protein